MTSREFRMFRPETLKPARSPAQLRTPTERERGGDDSERTGNPQAKALEYVQSAYQHIEIRRHPAYGNQLHIDGDLQISASDHAYNTAMTAPLLAGRDCRRVVILGGGDGGVLNELLRGTAATGHVLERVTLIDIDPDVVRLARRHLRAIAGDAFEHPRAEILNGDAFAYVRTASALDAVVYDLTMEPVRAGQSREAFIGEIVAQIAAALRPGGVLSMQAGGTHDGELIGTIRAAVERHFSDVLEQKVLVPSFGELWTFIAARKPLRAQ